MYIGPEHRRAADAQSADKTKNDQRIPVPGEGATQSGDEIEDGHHPQAVATSETLTRNPRQHGAQDRPEERAEYRDAQEKWREAVGLGECAGGAGDDGGVESEKKAAQSGHDRALQQRCVQLHADSSLSEMWPGRLRQANSPQVITEQTSIHWTESHEAGEYGYGGRMDRSNSSKIKAVILDYGEVLCYPPTAEEMGRMASLFGVEPGLFRKLWDRDRLLYDRGDLSPEAYWAAVAKDAGTPVDAGATRATSPVGC